MYAIDALRGETSLKGITTIELESVILATWKNKDIECFSTRRNRYIPRVSGQLLRKLGLDDDDDDDDDDDNDEYE